ncbi:MAG: hypothetical protein ACP5M0_02675 [Desulfomonilaceae bacterium]
MTRHVFVALVIAAVICCVEEQYDALAWISDVDTGVIASMSDDTVYMQGQAGQHVFQLMGICTWCEDGADIVAVFEGLTHATLAPYPNYFGKPPVRALVVKDGREEF